MHPQGLLGVTPFLLLLPVAVWVAAEVIWPRARTEGVAGTRLILFQICLIFPALAGAKLFSLIERGWPSHPIPPGSALIAGWRFPGALVALLIAVPILHRLLLRSISLARYADILAIGVAFGEIPLRFSCFLNGCCTGAVCSSWLCLAYPEGSQVWGHHAHSGLIAERAAASLPVLPLHFLFALGALLIGLVLIRVDRTRSFSGETALTFVTLHESLKFVLEQFRVPASPSLQATSFVLAACGLLALIPIAFAVRRISTVPSEGTADV